VQESNDDGWGVDLFLSLKKRKGLEDQVFILKQKRVIIRHLSFTKKNIKDKEDNVGYI